MESNLIASCCNGGVPYINLNVWPLNGTVIEPLEPPFRHNSIPPDHLPPTNSCDLFAVKFGSDELQERYFREQGSVGCRCPNFAYGKRCEALLAASTGNGGHSFKIFLYLAIIPLAFGLIAAIGGFLCKMCCCDCFDWTAEDCKYCACCCRKRGGAKRKGTSKSGGSASSGEDSMQTSCCVENPNPDYHENCQNHINHRLEERDGYRYWGRRQNRASARDTAPSNSGTCNNSRSRNNNGVIEQGGLTNQAMDASLISTTTNSEAASAILNGGPPMVIPRGDPPPPYDSPPSYHEQDVGIQTSLYYDDGNVV